MRKHTNRLTAILLALTLAMGLLPLWTVMAGATESTTPMLAAGSNHTIALKSDGTVWAWGYNDSGQLGDSTTTKSSVPVQVVGLSDVTAIAAYSHFTIALKNDGTVWSWGRNNYGQLGDGTTANSSTPVQVVGLDNVTAIAAGEEYTIALKNDGTVWAWGHNDYGQLGNDTTVDSTTPVQVSGLTDVIAIAAGSWAALVLKNDGTVWAWGQNAAGQLGNGTYTTTSTPVQAAGLTDVIAIGAGSNYSLALKSDETVWSWGWGSYGQLGSGKTTPPPQNIPEPIPGLTGVNTIIAGKEHVVALKSNGTTLAWGRNENGQVGDGTTTQRNTPVQIDVSDVTSIALGWYHTAELKSDGTVWVWGFNGHGQLGDGTNEDSITPVQVKGAGGTGYLILTEEPWSYSLEVSASDNGTVTDGEGSHLFSNSNPWAENGLTVAALPDTDYQFDGWYDENDALVSAQNPYTINSMPSYAALVAKFSLSALAIAKEAKIAAINAIDDSLNQADYTAESWQALQTAITTAIAEVNAATTITEVDTVAVPTTDGLVTIASVLAAAKEAKIAAINAVDDGLNQADYTAESWQALQTAISSAIAQVNAATTVDAVNAISAPSTGGLVRANSVDNTKYIKLWGKTTKYISNFGNWLMVIFLFGWIWMAF